MKQTLSTEELQRYQRHLALPEFGLAGQEKLKNASVLIIGAGGLGSPSALYLAAAGVGRLGLVDFDQVDASNLQRQLLHGEADVGRPKVQSARDALHRLNSRVQLDLHEVRLDSGNALTLLRGYDLVLDGTDNFTTRYLVNDACVLLGKPNVYGSIFRFEGQASVFHAGLGPCYRCLYPEPPPSDLIPNCAEGGVLGVLPGLIGVIQATEAIKLLTGIGEPLIGRLLLYDALKMTVRTLRINRDPDCPVCGSQPSIKSLADTVVSCNRACTPVKEKPMIPEVNPVELNKELAAGRKLVLLDVREPHEHALGTLPKATLLPLGQLPQALSTLNPESDIVAYCKAGGRSAQAVAFLQQQGFRKIRNLTGGILAWADKIDPSLPKY